MPVRPGDLITSAFVNELLERIAVLEGQGNQGATSEVPLLFGHTLGESRLILASAAGGFIIAGARDVFGATIDPASTAMSPRVVVGQSPSAGTRAPTGSALFVLLAGSAATGGGTPTAPTISGRSPTEQRIGLNLLITGTGLTAGSGVTTVRFDGVSATIVAQTSGAVSVRIPEGIPGAPTTENGRKSGVVVQLTNANGSTSFTMDILGRQAGQPQVDVVAPGNLVLDPRVPAGASFTIGGTDLVDAAGSTSVVVFENSPNSPLPATGSPTSLVVTLPPNWPLAPAQGSSQSFQFRVRVTSGTRGNQLSNLATITVATPSIIL